MTVSRFRYLVVLTIGLDLVVYTVGVSGITQLPLLLHWYEQNWIVTDVFPSDSGGLTVHLEHSSATDTTGIWIGLCASISLLIVSGIGLVLLRPWGAWLLLLVLIVQAAWLSFYEAHVVRGWVAAAYMPITLLYGFILAVVLAGAMHARFFHKRSSSEVP